MTDPWALKRARSAHWGLEPELLERLMRLDTPEAVQDFVAAIPMNFEDDTCWSVREVLHRNVAMCMEGAFVAAAALQLQGRPPLLLRMFSNDDQDHVVALFLRKGRWGAISKTNHLWLRWRDPIYHSVRDLMMSYVHEYVTGADKTLRGHGDPFDLRRLQPSEWVTRPDSCQPVNAKQWAWGYYPLFNEDDGPLRPRDALELQGDALVELRPRRGAQAPGEPATRLEALPS